MADLSWHHSQVTLQVLSLSLHYSSTISFLALFALWCSALGHAQKNQHRQNGRPGNTWILRYRELLSDSEFTKFVVFMRNLAPYLLLLIVDPSKANNHRRDRNPTIGRQTLELILYGHPDAVSLFQ